MGLKKYDVDQDAGEVIRPAWPASELSHWTICSLHEAACVAMGSTVCCSSLAQPRVRFWHLAGTAVVAVTLLCVWKLYCEQEKLDGEGAERKEIENATTGGGEVGEGRERE